MKKIHILFALLFSFSIFMLKTGSVYAECQEINPFVSSCGNGGLGIFQCSDQNVNYCCSQSSVECQVGTITISPTPAQHCSNGAADGARTCVNGYSYVCSAGQNPEFTEGVGCESWQQCQEFFGCVNLTPTPVPASLPTSTCDNGAPDGAYTCGIYGTGLRVVFKCCATCQNQYVQQNVCADGQRCNEGSFTDACVGDAVPTSGVPGSPSTPPKGTGNLTNASFLIRVNPLHFAVEGSNVFKFYNPGSILNVLMPFLFVFAGLILFIMLLWGGFEMLSSAATPDSKNAGQQRITAAIIGFVLLFVSYWIAQIVQFITGVNILG